MPDTRPRYVTPPDTTPAIDCERDDDWRDQPECTTASISVDAVDVESGIIRGGFGGYFWTSGS